MSRREKWKKLFCVFCLFDSLSNKPSATVRGPFTSKYCSRRPQSLFPPAPVCSWTTLTKFQYPCPSGSSLTSGGPFRAKKAKMGRWRMGRGMLRTERADSRELQEKLRRRNQGASCLMAPNKRRLIRRLCLALGENTTSAIPPEGVSAVYQHTILPISRRTALPPPLATAGICAALKSRSH
ncbi:hypothetical protein HDV57DRAFT_329270 [Trichoderma longibrachiatum]